MAASWIARSHVTDPVVYKKYTDRVPAIVSKHGGRILARGGRYQIMAGPQTFERYVVIEFPTLEQGVACFQSPGTSRRRSTASREASSRRSSLKASSP